jgi:hypothetical protein
MAALGVGSGCRALGPLYVTFREEWFDVNANAMLKLLPGRM